MFSKIFLPVLFFFSSLPAHAIPSVTFDRPGGLAQGGMPLCILSADRYEYVEFLWNSDPYARSVYAILDRARLDDPRNQAGYRQRCFLPQGASRPTLPSFEEWPLSNRVIAITEKDSEIFRGVTNSGEPFYLEETLRKAFAQVRKGGNVYREEQTGEDYFLNHPVAVFDLNLNRELTQKFGVAFASGYYKAWVESFQKNKELKSAVLSWIQAPVSFEHLGALLRERLQNTVIVAVKGYAHTWKKDYRFRDLLSDLRGFGLEVLEGDTLPYGWVVENVDSLTRQLENLLQQKKNILLIGGSRGVMESLGAIARLSPKLEGAAKDPNYGKVLGLISVSAVISGSFVATWATSEPYWSMAVKKTLYQSMSKKDPDHLNDPNQLETFRDLSIPFSQKYYFGGLVTPGPKNIPELLPKDTVYFSLIGALSQAGLANDEDVGYLQETILRAKPSKYLRPFGANDGYEEYPGSAIPDAWVNRSYSLVFNSSHPILDGDFNGFSLRESDVRKRVISALLLEITARLGK